MLHVLLMFPSDVSTVNGDKLFSCAGSGLPAVERMAFWKEGTTLLLVLLVLLVLLDLQPVAGRSSHHRSLRRQTRGHHEQRAHKNITLAVILPQSNTDYPWAWPRVGPALERAVEAVNADPTLLPDHHLTYAFKNSEDKDGICSESVAPLMAVDLKLVYDPWAFIGPGCSYTASPVGLFTTHWDVPMVTAGAPAVAFYGGVYPSITNTGPTHKKLGKFALRICEHFGWREHVMLMFSDNKVDDRPCYFAVEGLFTELKSINITLADRVFEENKPVNYSQILTDVRNDGRGESPKFLFAAVKDYKIMRCFSSSQLDAFPGPLSSYWLKPDLGVHLRWIIGCKPPTVVGGSALVCQHSKLSEDVTQIQTNLLQSMDWGLTYSRLQTICLLWLHQCLMAGKAHVELISITSIERLMGNMGWDEMPQRSQNETGVLWLVWTVSLSLHYEADLCSAHFNHSCWLIDGASCCCCCHTALLFSLCLRLFVHVLAQV